MFRACLPKVSGALPKPANASKPISAASISWPATYLPATSPKPPPAISTAPVTPAATIGALLNPAVANLPPTPLAIPNVAISTAAIATPLFKALFFKSASFSGSWSIFFILSGSKPPASSCNNSANVKPVSIAPIVPPMAPATAPPKVDIPGKGIAEPATAPVAAAAAPAALTSSERKELIWLDIELTNIVESVDGFSTTPFIKPQKPPPSSSYVLLNSRISAEPRFFLATSLFLFTKFKTSWSVDLSPKLYSSKAGSINSPCLQPSSAAVAISLKKSTNPVAEKKLSSFSKTSLSAKSFLYSLNSFSVAGCPFITNGAFDCDSKEVSTGANSVSSAVASAVTGAVSVATAVGKSCVSVSALVFS